jgi:hypothetical protein
MNKSNKLLLIGDRMTMLEKYKIKSSKKNLFLFAGLVWVGAGGKVFSLGFKDFTLNVDNPLIFIPFSVTVFFLFFKFIFNKMVKKHTKRIMLSELKEHCIFSFFDVKGYIIMIFMITGGIVLRNSHIVNPIYLGTFYLGLGFALFLAGIRFIINFINFEKLQIS